MINPIEHSKTNTLSEKYKVEPYCISADVYGQGNLAGRGGWTWYTGSSSWMYIAGIKYILGINICENYLLINPTISKEWKEYKVRIIIGESIYNIKVKNEFGKNSGVSKVIVNGEEVESKKIKLSQANEIFEVEVIL